MEVPAKVHRHKHRRTSSRRQTEDTSSTERPSNERNERNSSSPLPSRATTSSSTTASHSRGQASASSGINSAGGLSAATLTIAGSSSQSSSIIPAILPHPPSPRMVIPVRQQPEDRSHQMQNGIQEQPSVLVNGHEPFYENEINGLDNSEVGENNVNNVVDVERSSSRTGVGHSNLANNGGASGGSHHHLGQNHHNIQSQQSHQLNSTLTTSRRPPSSTSLKQDDKHHLQKDPQASPAQRSTRSRSSLEKSPRRKRSKSESRRRRERKLIAAGEMEVRQANETLMRYLKQCSEMNDASLSGELEIDHNFDERRVHRKTKSQRDRNGYLLSKTNDLSEDIVPAGGEIYNPFTPVVSPTEGPPTRIDKMFIQTSNGYRAVDHCFYKHPIGSDPESNSKNDLSSIMNISCTVRRIWIMISNICHGLLGGLALAHLLFISTNRPYDWAEGAARHYSSFAAIYAGIFYCLAIVCMISVLDRMDICHIDIMNAVETISFKWIVIAMIYIATIILTLCAESMDGRFYTTTSNATLAQEDLMNNQSNVWSCLSIARNVGAIVGWIMIGLSPIDDLLYDRLLEMEKYQLTNN